jgi:hypothetical protein
VVQPKSRVSLRRVGPQRLVYRVELGAARLQSAQGGSRVLQRGAVVEVGIGLAVLEKSGPAVAAAKTASASTAGQPAAPAATQSPQALTASAAVPPAAESPQELAASAERGRVAAIGAGPAHPSVIAAAGESFTVHAARVPIAVAFDVGARCPGEAVLVLDGRPRARGRRVSALVPAGKHAYGLRCVLADGTLAPGPALTGSVTALRDAGTAQLPRRAPTAFVDADGKTYTVLYQNHLPRIELRWPGAPASARYLVHVEPGVKRAPLSSRKPEHAFASGALGEGRHALYFTTPDGARSKTATLEIRFDNAAPKASVSTPRDGSFAPGANVKVAGVALPGWQVTLPTGTLALDRQFRFVGTATTSEAQPDIALRFSSPRGGVHYYVRRASGGR